MDYSLLGKDCEDKINNGWNQLRYIDWSIKNGNPNDDLINSIDKFIVDYPNSFASIDTDN